MTAPAHAHDAKDIRSFGIGLFPFGLILLTLACLRGHPGRGAAAAGVAWALGGVVLAFPGIGRPVYRGWMALASVLGAIVSNALLALVFYGLVTPVGLLRRLLGADPLGLAPGGESLWKDIPPVKDRSRYERLY